MAPCSQGPTACPQIPTYESILKIHPLVVHEFHSSHSQDKNLGANDSVDVLGGRPVCGTLAPERKPPDVGNPHQTQGHTTFSHIKTNQRPLVFQDLNQPHVDAQGN